MLAAPLGDRRRNVRALEIVTALVQGHGAAVDGVHAADTAGPWAHAMGCFRFYDNDALTLPDLYAPCRTALAELVPRGARAYVVHDLSVLDYSFHDAKPDRVQVGDGRGRGYELYSALVVDAAGRPLGPVVQELRTARGCLSSETPDRFAFRDHYTQVERGVATAAQHLPGRDLVHVLDREFDELALERWLTAHDAAFIIRAQHLRRVVHHRGARRSLQQVVRGVQRQPAGQVTRQRATFELWLGETAVEFVGRAWRGYQRRGTAPRAGAAIPVRVVVAELRRGGRVVHRWVLLTNLPDPCAEIVRAYVWRWKVERLFFLLKVGFDLEAWRQETGERIARRLALSGLAAMAIYQLEAAAADADVAVALRAIATAGGWLGRKGDALGPIVLMRGMHVWIGALALYERYGTAELKRIGRILQDQLGLPLPALGRAAHDV